MGVKAGTHYTEIGRILMIAEKISQPLAESLRNQESDDLMDVIVEIAAPPADDAPGSSQAEKIASRKAAFAQQAQPVSDKIRRLGGELTGQAWINGSLRARVTKNAVPALSDEALAARLDLPRMLQADVK